jgi:hypothetical protein
MELHIQACLGCDLVNYRASLIQLICYNTLFCDELKSGSYTEDSVTNVTVRNGNGDLEKFITVLIDLFS